MLLCLQADKELERVGSLPFHERKRAVNGDVTIMPELIPAVTQEQPAQTPTDSVKPASSTKVILITLSLSVASVSLQAVVSSTVCPVVHVQLNSPVACAAFTQSCHICEMATSETAQGHEGVIL